MTDNYLHYVRKSDITRSTVEGTNSRALCGESFVAFGLTGGGMASPVSLRSALPVSQSSAPYLPQA